jgi:hypothetical protein
MENDSRMVNRPEECGVSRPKFRRIKFEVNELQSKYEIYKNGTPNIYEKNMEILKEHQIKNGIKAL